MKKLLITTAMSLTMFALSAMAGQKEWETVLGAGSFGQGSLSLPQGLYKVNQLSDYDKLTAAIQQVDTLWSGCTNKMTPPQIDASAAQRDLLKRQYTAMLATKTVTVPPVQTKGDPMVAFSYSPKEGRDSITAGNEAAAFAMAAAHRLQWADEAYVDSFIVTNAHRMMRVKDIESVGCDVVDLNSAKRNLKLKVVAQVACKDLAFPHFPKVVTDAARRVEIIERRAAGLSVVGPTSLPKTAALTAALNSGSGLSEALSAYGVTIPASAIAAKVAAANELKASFNSGVKDPSAADLDFMSTWLGLNPVAAWVKSYNGQ